MKKEPSIWRRNEDGSMTFKLVKSASATLVQDNQVAMQVTFQHKPSDDPEFTPETIQFLMPAATARELAKYIQQFVETAEPENPVDATIH